jgi:hypothetical protein
MKFRDRLANSEYMGLGHFGDDSGNDCLIGALQLWWTAIERQVFSNYSTLHA